jgi:hypothetical protein
MKIKILNIAEKDLEDGFKFYEKQCFIRLWRYSGNVNLSGTNLDEKQDIVSD